MPGDPADPTTWEKAHSAYLEVHLHRMRLLVERRIAAHHGHHGNGTGPGTATESSDTGGVAPVAAVEIGADLDPDRLTRAIAAHEARLAEYEAELPHLGGPDGITSLCAAAGLDAIEREAVIAALCVELDPAIGELYAYLHGDPKRHRPSPALIAGLLQADLPDVWGLLDPHRPGRRFRILRLDGEGAGAALRLDGRIVDYIRGHNHVDGSLTGLVTVMPEVAMPPRFDSDVDGLAGWLGDPDRSNGPVTINLVGSSAETRRGFAARLVRAVGMHPLRLHADRLVTRIDRIDLVGLVEREAVLLPAAVYVEAPGGAGEDPATIAAVQEVVEELGGLVVIGSAQRWDVNRSVVVQPIEALRPADALELWRVNLVDEVAGLDDVVEQFTLGPESIRRAAAEAAAIRDIRGATETAPDDVWQACRRYVGRELGDLAARLETSAGWDDIVLPAGQTALLHEIAAQVRRRARVYEDWGFGERLHRGRGISALFTGPPGTGKTMAAEILAADLELDLYRVDLASVVSKYIGETEKNLRRVFDAAEQGGAILFFDEADALFGKRTEVKDSHDRHANVEINYLLQRMEQYTGLAILATNRKSDLDPAFLRRIRFLVVFPFPDAADRRRIWELVFPDDVPRGPLDNEALARLEVAGGNINNIAVNGAFIAADADEPVRMEHLMRAARHEYRKTDRLPTRSEFGEWYGEATS